MSAEHTDFPTSLADVYRGQNGNDDTSECNSWRNGICEDTFGKQALLSRLARLTGGGRKKKVRYVVPSALESLLAQHFVWRLRRTGGS